MRITIKILASILLFLSVNQLPVRALQKPLSGQFTSNKFIYNPAAAGSEQITQFKVAAFSQWGGLEGAPKFHTASFDTRLFDSEYKHGNDIPRKNKLVKNATVGTGFNIFHEKYGTLSNTGFSVTYSYHIKLGYQQLSFGFSPEISSIGLNASQLIMSSDEYDAAISEEGAKQWNLDFNFGFLLSDPYFFAGYSIYNLSESAIQWGGTPETNFKAGRQHYIMGGYNFEISGRLNLEPSMLIKISESTIVKSQVDIGVRTIILHKYWAGMSYKTSKTFAFFGGIQIDRYSFCYSFDYTMGIIRKVNSGSHEIQFGVLFGDNYGGYKR